MALFLKSKKIIFFLIKMLLGIPKENRYCPVLNFVQGKRIVKVSIFKQTKECVHFFAKTVTENPDMLVELKSSLHLEKVGQFSTIC